MMEAVRTPEMLVIIYLTTQQYIPEDSKLHFNIVFPSTHIYKDCNIPPLAPILSQINPVQVQPLL
jgi:hypothetical protein